MNKEGDIVFKKDNTKLTELDKELEEDLEYIKQYNCNDCKSLKYTRDLREDKIKGEGYLCIKCVKKAFGILNY